MATARLRYQNGQLTPLDPMPGLSDGDEIDIEWRLAVSPEDVTGMLDHTRGMWADWEDVEALLDEARQEWEKAWRDRLSS